MSLLKPVSLNKKHRQLYVLLVVISALGLYSLGRYQDVVGGITLSRLMVAQQHSSGEINGHTRVNIWHHFIEGDV